ncbi:cobalt-precorrin-5B (C(1))-methyltransferase CbiD [Methanothermobacter sp. K4]|uniref:cobalt-precorrin-5B (C(1))-methyltransferase CbiD n=1 Tax=Methanothermobacter sp. K4 TaxID=2913262 RepID=UPI001EDAACAA|nr:cobalt-precorrin-5B (C(1))-methyltransferase CbiD [Methanothermobacter sp. K4]MCG2828788.1 cobalt-precorrin-5B (C(1))-methyltransferase CbiD [Methanothermobacter sp. K4]
MRDERVFGITTGTAATAAALASLLCLRGRVVNRVCVETPSGKIHVDVDSVERISQDTAQAGVIKRPYGDPDVTVNLRIMAEVQITETEEIVIRGGEGVGTVTKPGLQVPPGEAAINPVPRRMIENNLRKYLKEGEGAIVTVSVPDGEKIASKTMNPRLGIEGGISILGTSGIARPMSSSAYRRSLACQIDIAVARGFRELVLVPGNIGERFAREYFKSIEEERIIQMANFPGYMMGEAAKKGVDRVILIGHAGKLIKLSAGIFQTKNSIADARREIMTAHAALSGAEPEITERIFNLATVEEMISELERVGLREDVFNSISRSIMERCSERFPFETDVLIFSLDGRILNSNFKTAPTHRFIDDSYTLR